MWGLIGQLQQEQTDELVKTALDAGINFIDTANVYGGGASERGSKVIAVMREIAAGKDIDGQPVSVAQIALAWLLHQNAVSSVIVGAKRVDQLRDNLQAAQIRFSDDELAALEDVSRLPAEYPGWMLERQGGYRAQ